jgi:DNA mismatch endonuclease (patch repair protein)
MPIAKAKDPQVQKPASGLGPEKLFSGLTRSQLMSRIRSKGNKTTEQALSRLLAEGAVTGWRRHLPLAGHPDFVFKKSRIAVFVDGCFWHGCASCYQAPKTRPEFWQEKVRRNRKRDRVVNKLLRSLGWRVVRIRECQLKENPTGCVRRIRAALSRQAAASRGISSNRQLMPTSLSR